jgi:hypothetical protein
MISRRYATPALVLGTSLLITALDAGIAPAETDPKAIADALAKVLRRW